MITLYQKDKTAARRRIPLLIVGTDGITPATGEAAGQPQVSKNGATPVNTTGTLVTINATQGLYYVELTGAELDTLGWVLVTYKDTDTAVAREVVQVLPGAFPTIIVGEATAGTLSTTQMTTDLTETTDDHYLGRLIIFTSGNLYGQATDITDYNGTSKMFTFTALTEAMSAGDQFVIV